MLDLSESSTYREIFREGMAEGLARRAVRDLKNAKSGGLPEWKEELLERLINRRLCDLLLGITDRIDNLTPQQTSELSKVWFRFTSIAQFEEWLASH